MATSGQQTRGITNLQRMVGKVRDVHRGGFPGSLALNPTYWKERLDPLHRPTTQLNPLWYVFLRDPNRGPDFFAWLARREAGEVRGVRYLELEDRATYRITFSNADGGVRVNFHPSLLGLSQDEKEVIFVLDRAGNFYVGQKEVGRFHHSSFLAGAPVLAAGSMRLTNGRIGEVNNHSGHYHPGISHLTHVARAMQTQGVNVQNVNIVMYGPGNRELSRNTAAQLLGIAAPA